MKIKRILAWIGIALLLGLYLINLVLALIGSDAARDMLKITAASTVAIPIILYGFFIAIGGNRRRYEAEIEDAMKRRKSADPEELPPEEADLLPEEAPAAGAPDEAAPTHEDQHS